MEAFFGGALTDRERHKFRHFTHISLKHRYLYISTPKVACSSILLTLQRAEFEDATFIPEPWDSVHARHFSPLLYPDQVARFGRRIQSADFFKFCFVRNPYTRIGSCYYDKVVKTDYLSNRLFSAIGRKGRDVSFEDFLTFVANEPAAHHDEHYAVQADHLFVDLIPFSFVGRFETLAVDMRTVAARIGLDIDSYEGKLDQHRTHADIDPGIFTHRARSQIRDIYRRDFLTFGYED